MLRFATAVLLAAMPSAYAQLPSCDPTVGSSCSVRPGPADQTQATYNAWEASRQDWRSKIRGLLEAKGDNFTTYSLPGLAWTQTSYIQPQVMLHERTLYDRATDTWTVDKYLDDLIARYGGIDSVLLWQGYPNMGADDRNQFDMIRNLPGGVEGVKGMVRDFHERGVKVLLPYYPWDRGTRNQGEGDFEALASLVVEVDADGINGDTCDGVNYTFIQNGLADGKALAAEAQSMGTRGIPTGWENVTHDVMSWGENWNYAFAPLVSAFKTLDSRHLTHIVERFAWNRTNGLHHTFLNGIGYETWENVWGMWNQITDFDAETIRRIAAISREYGNVLTGGSYEPHVPLPVCQSCGVFASRFRNATHDVVTVVNRVDREMKGSDGELAIPCVDGDAFYDLYRGAVLQHDCSGGSATVRLLLEPFGIGAVAIVRAGGEGRPRREFLEQMRGMTANPLEVFSKSWKFLPQTMADKNEKTEVPATVPAGMARVEGGLYDWSVRGNIQQGDGLPFSVDVQYPWEPHPSRNHKQLLEIHDLLVDIHPVTNAEYKKFIDEAAWTPPVTSQNWLKDWSGEGAARTFPEGAGKQPVVWVSRDDAKAYCKQYKLRLPHDWEWQWAAQGNTTNAYPWGNGACADCMPPKSSERTQWPASDVDAHPSGRSAAGMEDLTGNVFQWTDEFCDTHTCMSTVRGGTYYAPRCLRPPDGQGGSCNYYFVFPQNLNTHNTWLVMSESMDRTKSFGFRCVADGVANPPPCAGQLCMDAPLVLEGGTQIDLTNEGVVDWMHLGKGSLSGAYPQSIDQKAAGDNAIAPGVMGDDVPRDHTMGGQSQVLYSWSDGGDPAPSETGTSTELRIGRDAQVGRGAGLGNGFTLTVRGDRNGRMTAKVYVALDGGKGRFIARLSGGATQATETLESYDGVTNACFTVHFLQTDAMPLSISWELVEGGAGSHISLSAVTLDRTAGRREIKPR